LHKARDYCTVMFPTESLALDPLIEASTLAPVYACGATICADQSPFEADTFVPVATTVPFESFNTAVIDGVEPGGV
jgi:hypothetical protein